MSQSDVLNHLLVITLVIITYDPLLEHRVFIATCPYLTLGLAGSGREEVIGVTTTSCVHEFLTPLPLVVEVPSSFLFLTIPFNVNRANQFTQGIKLHLNPKSDTRLIVSFQWFNMLVSTKLRMI